MSQENVEVVRRAVEAAISRPPKWGTVNSLFDRHHELVEQTDFVDFGGTRVGAEGFGAWRTLMDQAGDWRGQIEDARAVPDGRVAVLLRFLMTGQRSGAQVGHKMCVLCTVENGRVKRTESFAGWDEPLKAVGLEE